jgi:S-adenosylmethionine synthetase
MSMRSIMLASLPSADETVEVVERKGVGHPDTICDALAETLSRELSQAYLARFGEVLHHNVDKALLCAGRASPAFGGGRVDAPMDIYLAGRAVAQVGRERLPIREIAVESARAWLRTHLHALDADRHVRLHPVLRPGSQDLRNLFRRTGRSAGPLANDTSIGVGYAPLSPLEALVVAVESAINPSPSVARPPAWGEDVKVMGVRIGSDVELTLSSAMIGAHLRDLDHYLEAKSALEALACETAGRSGFASCRVRVNAADDLDADGVYLTVTGTSAESGDDGQVGRGNRVNGLITPGRPMSLEAAAGKNPVTHVGKLYNVAAHEIAKAIVASAPEIAQARCLLLSRIGSPITEPAAVSVQIAAHDAGPVERFRPVVEHTVSAALSRLPDRIPDFVAGRIGLY